GYVASSRRRVADLADQRGNSGGLRAYAWGLLAIGTVTAASFPAAGYLRLSDIVMIYLLAVVVVAARFDIAPSLATAALAALTFDFFFLPPVFSFRPVDPQTAMTLSIMIVVAGVISGVCDHARRRHRAALQRERLIEVEQLRSTLLGAVSHDLKTPLAT